MIEFLMRIYLELGPAYLRRGAGFKAQSIKLGGVLN